MSLSTPWLDCPLCGVSIGLDPAATEVSCPGCSGRAIGNTETSLAAAAVVSELLEIDPSRLGEFATGLFSIDDGHPLARQIAITSDHRDGFYHWWVMLADHADRSVLRQALAPS